MVLHVGGGGGSEEGGCLGERGGETLRKERGTSNGTEHSPLEAEEVKWESKRCDRE